MSVGAGHISEVLQQIKEILARVKDPMRDDWDPILLSLLISKLEYEDLDIAAQMQNFSTLVNEVEQGLPKNSNLKDQTAHVISVFAGALQFEGDKTNYYNIKNAFMSDVLVRRKGIPISLCLTFMGLCRGVGLRSVGISFPGHFLVRMVPVLDRKDPSNNFEEAEDWKQQWFVDCFDRGALMSVQDCERRLNEWTRGAVPFGPEALKVAHPTEIVSRMLRNLRAIFGRAGLSDQEVRTLRGVVTALSKGRGRVLAKLAEKKAREDG